MLIHDSPLGMLVQANCVTLRPLPEFCDPCYFTQKFLPRIISVSKKDDTVLRELMRVALEPIQTLSTAMCGFCVSADTDDCACFEQFYSLIGAPKSYIVDNTDYCLVPTQNININICGDDEVYKYYCNAPCFECNTHFLDCGTDLELMKKIANAKTKWQFLAGTVKNLEACLSEWYGRDCKILQEEKGRVFWSGGQELTQSEKEQQFLIYSLLPIFGGVNLTHVWR